MRVIAALLSLCALAAATPARDWREAAVKTPAGAYVIGNPAARVKLVEYASYTCPHCAAFAAESAPVLKEQMIRSGAVSLEYRHLIRDGLDLGAAILARCTGPRGFAATSAYIFATQDKWLMRGIAFQEANGQRIAMYPRLGQLRALADGAGLTAMIQAHGLSPVAIDACFADGAEVDRIVRLTSSAPAGVNSTPTFFINGQKTPNVDWARLEPLLRAAGAR